MDRFGLWGIPYMVVVLTAGEMSRQALAPALLSSQPDWPVWLVKLIAPLPGLVPMIVIGYLIFRRLDPSREIGHSIRIARWEASQSWTAGEGRRCRRHTACLAGGARAARYSLTRPHRQ